MPSRVEDILPELLYTHPFLSDFFTGFPFMDSSDMMLAITIPVGFCK